MRRIEIFGEITEEQSNNNASIILDYISKDTEALFEENYIEPLYVFINSEGGPIYLYYFYKNLFKLYKGEIITINMCLAESSAFHIFMLGDTRKCFDNSKFLLHAYSSSYNSCNKNSILEDIKESDYYFEGIWNDIVAKSNIEKKFILDIIESKKNYYFYSAEAINLGFATEII